MADAVPKSPEFETPKWLEALEQKRKRTHKLAHDVGAGAPCLVCKEKCTGLNLHFWRKVCVECKCKKEDHDIQEEDEYSQFEILLGSNKVKQARIKFKAQNNTFDWVPPNVTPELALDYLNALPSAKLPISNSDGAKYRKQQLEKQLPLHDLDPSACHELSAAEINALEKYLDNLKNNVVGQGIVTKYQDSKLYKGRLIKAAQKVSSVQQTQSLAHQTQPYIGQQPITGSLYRDPSLNQLEHSYAIDTDSQPIGGRMINTKPTLYGQENIPPNFPLTSDVLKNNQSQFSTQEPRPFDSSLVNKQGPHSNTQSVPIGGKFVHSKLSTQEQENMNVNQLTGQIPQGVGNDQFGVGGRLVNDKVVGYFPENECPHHLSGITGPVDPAKLTGNATDYHDPNQKRISEQPYDGRFVRNNIPSFQQNDFKNTVGSSIFAKNLSGPKPFKSIPYESNFPTHHQTNETVPVNNPLFLKKPSSFVDPALSFYQKGGLQDQKYTSNPQNINYQNVEEDKIGKFYGDKEMPGGGLSSNNSIPAGKRTVGDVLGSSGAITDAYGGKDDLRNNNRLNYPRQLDSNFNTMELDQLPVEDVLAYNLQQTNLANAEKVTGPGVHYSGGRKLETGQGALPYDSRLVSDPTMINQFSSAAGDVPFAPVQGTGVMKPMQGQHQQQLMEGPRILNPNQPYNEMQESFPEPPQICHQCCQVLSPDDIVVSTERGGELALWHARCFVCETCKELLVDLMYFYHKDNVYCGRHYSEMLNIPRCFACDELIFVKEYTLAEEQAFHIRHFCCYHCDKPLAGEQYIPKDGQPVCMNCYQLKYGKCCHTCQLQIQAGEQRVSWKELHFHVAPECFKCTACSKSLLGGKFVVNDNNVFCNKTCVQQHTK